MDTAPVAEQNLIEVPIYTPFDVARYLRAPVCLVMAMWHGGFPHHPEMFFHWFGKRLPFFGSDEEVEGIPELRQRWSFRRLADLYVRLFAVESLLELGRNELREGGRFERLGEAIWRILRNHSAVPVVFGSVTPTEGVAQMLQSCGDCLTDEQMHWMEKMLLLCLARFDMEGNAPSRLYPFSRIPVEGSPRLIVMDPTIRFGRPTLSGHGTPSDILQERHQAGDSIADLADDYGLPASDVEEAIRYEAMPLALSFPFFYW